MRTIDLTPTWSAVLPAWLAVAEQGYRTHNLELISNFVAEMRRMAEAADRWNAAHE